MYFDNISKKLVIHTLKIPTKLKNVNKVVKKINIKKNGFAYIVFISSSKKKLALKNKLDEIIGYLELSEEPEIPTCLLFYFLF